MLLIRLIRVAVGCWLTGGAHSAQCRQELAALKVADQLRALLARPPGKHDASLRNNATLLLDQITRHSESCVSLP